jgi:hypothetical protein
LEHCGQLGPGKAAHGGGRSTCSFAFTYDPTVASDSVALTVSGATGTTTVSFQFDPTTWAETENDALFLSTRAIGPASRIVLSNLMLSTPGLGNFIPITEPDGADPAQVAAIGPDARHSLQVMGTDLQQGFTLPSEVTLVPET